MSASTVLGGGGNLRSRGRLELGWVSAANGRGVDNEKVGLVKRVGKGGDGFGRARK